MVYLYDCDDGSGKNQMTSRGANTTSPVCLLLTFPVMLIPRVKPLSLAQAQFLGFEDLLSPSAAFAVVSSFTHLLHSSELGGGETLRGAVVYLTVPAW